MTWNMLMRAPLNIREAVNSVTFAHLRRFKKRNATQQVVVCFRFHHTITIRSTCKYFMWILDPLLILMDLTFADHITDKTGALTPQVGNGGKKSRRTKTDKIGSQIYLLLWIQLMDCKYAHLKTIASQLLDMKCASFLSIPRLSFDLETLTMISEVYVNHLALAPLLSSCIHNGCAYWATTISPA